MLMQSSLSNYLICEISVPLFIQHYAANGYCICIGPFLYSHMIPPAIVQSVLLYVLLLRLRVLTLR